MPRRFKSALLAFVLVALARGPVSCAVAQTSIESAPINYYEAEVDDPIARLQARVDSHEVELTFDSQWGYLPAVLEALEIPVSSQMLVFSKTSFQLRRITPNQPRALYINDEVYVGFVPGGDVVEITSTDPDLGPVFYALRQRETESPIFHRRSHDCTQCHVGSLTRNVPGHIVRSVTPGPDGTPIYNAGTHLIDHRSPLASRWGGWYVTGTHGDQQHMGNRWATDPDDLTTFDPSPGWNVESLEGNFDQSAYLSPHSDIVALMVLEHQGFVHNTLTIANYHVRRALHRQLEMNRLLERTDDYLSETNRGIIERSAERVVAALLFVDEAELTAPIRGTSGYAEEFSARGPTDSEGRSLRQFDMNQRMFRYPCSYLIYSEAFDALPDLALQEIYRRLGEILSGVDQSEAYAHLSAIDRQAILQILTETKVGLPTGWPSVGE